MGRLDQAMQRARQSGLSPAFGSIPEDADLKRMVAELTDEFTPKRKLIPALPPMPVLPAPVPATPLTTASSPAPVTPAPVTVMAAPKPPKPPTVVHDTDKEIKDLFFDTYFEKVWDGAN